jgi:hypothetical protein
MVTTALPRFSVLTVDVDAVGSTNPGQNFHMWFRGTFASPPLLPFVPTFNPLTDIPGLYSYIDAAALPLGAVTTITDLKNGHTYGAYGSHALPTVVAAAVNGRQALDFASASLRAQPAGIQTVIGTSGAGANLGQQFYTLFALVQMDDVASSAIHAILGLSSASAANDTSFLGASAGGTQRMARRPCCRRGGSGAWPGRPAWPPGPARSGSAAA